MKLIVEEPAIERCATKKHASVKVEPDPIPKEIDYAMVNPIPKEIDYAMVNPVIL